MKLKHSRLTHFQTNRLLEHFVAGTPARTTADLVDLNRNTVRQFYHKLREIIAWQIEEEWQFSGEIEVDESYFGGVRKEHVDEVLLVGVKFTPKLSLMPKRQLCSQSYG